ncbi:MAG: DNA polymerase I [Bacteroidetes bacterium]|nr:DNA polymerase I [Bacteroidota bacterium]
MSLPDNKLFLLDAMALIYRAYYAFKNNPRVSSKGVNTSAVFGFANTLFDVLRKEKPTHIGVAFDTIAPTVRHGDYEFYKAHREETPEDIISSLPLIHELLHAFNIPVLFVDGFEADDVIGTLAKQAEAAGWITYMMTSDKDFGQLVSATTLIYRPGKFGGDVDILGVKEVCEKFGVSSPEQVIDMLGLWGDASDNIPGIPGVGEVTARKLLAEFGSVENLVEHPEKVANEKLRQKVIEFKDQALMSKSLATIILDVPIAFEPSKLIMEAPDEQRLKRLFDELEFRALGERVFKWAAGIQDAESQKEDVRYQISDISHPTSDISHPPSAIRHPPSAISHPPSAISHLPSAISHPPSDISHPTSDISSTPHTYFLVTTPEARHDLIRSLKESKTFCFDTETTGIDPNNSELVGMSFSVKPHEAYYLPFPENYHETELIVQEFKEVLEDQKIEKVGQNMKFDIAILKWYGVDVQTPMFDTMMAHYLIQPDMRHNMDLLSEIYLKYKPVSIETLIGKKGSGQLSMRTVDTETVKEYAAEDADVTLQLKNVFEPMLAESDTRKLFDEIEIPLIPVLASMEKEGVRIDSSVLNEYSGELEKEVARITEEIYRDAGTTFNISSPKQLGDILYDRLKIVDKPKQTKNKQNSTSEDVLSKMEAKHPIISKILEYRSLTKLKSTYVDVLPGLVSPRDNRIHTSYNQAVAATGRLSSNNPNLQNIPIRTEKGREIRKAFVPRNENFTLLSADYSQIELRIIASMSGDKNMIAAFKNGEDIHQATAAKIYNTPLAEVSKDMRRNAKMVNFGIIYGISSFGLSERSGMSRKEAGDVIKQYFEQYPGIRKYMDNTIAFARANGYVETLMKRRRYLRDINSGNANVRGFAERNAINAPVQGTAADMIKIAMIRIFDKFENQKLRSRMILQVHDELVFDVYQPEVDEVKKIVAAGMKTALLLDVPVEIDMNTGANWLLAH